MSPRPNRADQLNVYTVYCDGASRKDGRGGWGAFITDATGAEEDIWGGTTDTTNNRMELMAVIETLWYLPSRSNVTLICDSKYVIEGATEYLPMWIRAGWRTSSNKPLKNADLWEEFNSAQKEHASLVFEWVKGHTGVEGNERADRLAERGVPKEQG